MNIFLGTKCDLNRVSNIVSTEEGERMKNQINANQFLECSSKNNENINEVIYEAVRAIVAGLPEPKHKSLCEECADYVRNCCVFNLFCSRK